MLRPAEAAALEAVLDDRIALRPGELDPRVRRSLDERVLLAPGRRGAAAEAVAEAAAARRFAWAGTSLTHGELLAAFAAHCADELDDVEVVEAAPTRLVARWRGRETSRVELRAGLVGVRRLVSETPTLLIAALDEAGPALVESFLDDPELRSRVLVLDPDRLEKIGAVRSSVFVYLEWFLRDAYRVKVLPAPAFTQGLVDRGIISLGMG